MHRVGLTVAMVTIGKFNSYRVSTFGDATLGLYLNSLIYTR